MNATVTRAVKKPAAKKAATRKAVPEPAVKRAPAKPATRSAPKQATARKTGAGSGVATGEPVPPKSPAATNKARRAVASDSTVPVSSNKGSARQADKIQKPVVSRSSEVATKTTKSTPSPANGEPLTEAQLLQMSEKDYMNAAQLAFFKARLQQLELDLLKNAGETTEHLRETVLVPDPADRATIEEEHALELRTRDRERKLLKKVQQSLAAIEAGDYGWCEETGEPIGIPRLLARPTATLSLEAQQRRELKQKLYGD